MTDEDYDSLQFKRLASIESFIEEHSVNPDTRPIATLLSMTIRLPPADRKKVWESTFADNPGFNLQTPTKSLIQKMAECMGVKENRDRYPGKIQRMTDVVLTDYAKGNYADKPGMMKQITQLQQTTFKAKAPDRRGTKRRQHSPPKSDEEMEVIVIDSEEGQPATGAQASSSTTASSGSAAGTPRRTAGS